MADDDLRINTLHRFAKHSPKLILQEYSHCEVPAGCGGVVLRWIDPDQGRPAVCRLFAAGGRGELWLDGVSLPSSHVLVRSGIRVIAIHLTREQPGPRPFALTVSYDDDRDHDLVSAGAAQWRATTVRPADGWTGVDFDATAWPAPTPATAELIARHDPWIAELTDRARGTPAFQHDGELWLRVAFSVEEIAR